MIISLRYYGVRKTGERGANLCEIHGPWGLLFTLAGPEDCMEKAIDALARDEDPSDPNFQTRYQIEVIFPP